MAKSKKLTPKVTREADKTVVAAAPTSLLGELRTLIAEARQRVARSVDSALVHLYWEIGHRIRTHILKEKRADYGKQIFYTLSRKLTEEFGRGFSQPNLFHMARFAEVFADRQVVQALCGQLGWSHFRQIIYLKEPLQRDFYAEMCRVETWSTRTLAAKIQGMLFERTAISRKPALLAKQELKRLREEDHLTPDLTFRDPYLLDFLGLKDTFSERDLETAILRELQGFLVELGTDFAFIARQKRIVIAEKDHYIDLLFFHRRLRRLVVIDLKLGAFQPADKGQMELYLRWLAKHEQQPHEEAPLGLILCAEKSAEYVE
ncbi:MAG: PDDEXK nuclease domain-containing protein, partial [Verrucomicrobiota bacterium]|nr:PDDEXK nuclease domain-containing protein [Verrucomicrobiota bacterium]